MKIKLFTILFAAAVCGALTVGCLNNEDDENVVTTPGGCPFNSASVFVVTSDFAVGAGAVISGSPPSTACFPGITISGDIAARVDGTRVYVVNRFGADNIQVLDGLNNYATLKQFSVGNGTNPQDIAVVSDTKAFVSRMADESIWVGNPTTGDLASEIDLSAHADPDGVPEAAKMVIINNRLFVALQRLDASFLPTDKSSIAVINTNTNAVVTVIDLATTNPVTRLIYNQADNKIYVGCSGKYQSFGYPTPDGGVETISVDTATDTYTADGVVIDEATLGGDVNGLAVVSATQAYALVSDASFNNYVIAFNPTTGVKGATLFTTTSFAPDLVVDGNGYLYLADRDTTNPGVRIWDTATDAMVGTVIDTGLPPYGLATMQ